MDADGVVREVAEAVGLAEGEAGVRDVLRAVVRLEPASTRAVSRATALPVPIVAAIAGELRRRGVLAPERPARLTAAARPLFSAARAAARPGDVMRLAELAAGAPAARSELDQSHCTVATTVRRTLALDDAGALAGRRVLLLGDDDLLALAVARLAPAVGELVVLDVDAAVLAYVARHAPGARVVAHDLRGPLPRELAARFDTVFTDPPYTCAGAELFLSRAVEALVPEVGGQVFLAFPGKPPREALRLQGAITRMGLVIRSVARNFNEYAHASILGGRSHLYHLVSAGAAAPLLPGRYDGPLYTGDGRPPRAYRCASCRSVHRVGRGAAWATVAVLRTDGCPECGATRFLPLPRRTRA